MLPAFKSRVTYRMCVYSNCVHVRHYHQNTVFRNSNMYHRCVSLSATVPKHVLKKADKNQSFGIYTSERQWYIQMCTRDHTSKLTSRRCAAVGLELAGHKQESVACELRTLRVQVADTGSSRSSHVGQYLRSSLMLNTCKDSLNVKNNVSVDWLRQTSQTTVQMLMWVSTATSQLRNS